MDRRGFLKVGGAAGLITGLSGGTARCYVPEHNWEKHDWGNGPEVKDRLYQGPFTQYTPDAEDRVPRASIVYLEFQ
jgi:hypothetical protein